MRASVTIPMVLMGVGEPDIGVFISTSTSESSSSLDGGVLCTNDRVPSRTSWIGQRLEPCPYLRYLRNKEENDLHEAHATCTVTQLLRKNNLI